MGLLNAIFGRDDPPEEVIQDCKFKIRGMLEAFNLNEGEEWHETEDGFLYQVGSAVIFNHLAVDEHGDSFVILNSPIVKLPPDNLLAFYRRLLELNFEGSGQAAVGVDHDTVHICATRDVDGLGSELAEVIIAVGNMADNLDDYLHDEFGAPLVDWEEE